MLLLRHMRISCLRCNFFLVMIKRWIFFLRIGMLCSLPISFSLAQVGFATYWCITHTDYPPCVLGPAQHRPIDESRCPKSEASELLHLGLALPSKRPQTASGVWDSFKSLSSFAISLLEFCGFCLERQGIFRIWR